MAEEMARPPTREPAPATGRIDASIERVRRLDSGTLHPQDGAAFELVVANGTARSIFVYKRWLRFAYDEAEQRLRLELRQRPWVPTNSSADCHVMEEPFLEIRPFERVGLPQVAWLEYDTSDTMMRMKHVRLDVATLAAEVAWSDEPLEWHKSGCNAERAAALLPLERGIVTASIAMR